MATVAGTSLIVPAGPAFAPARDNVLLGGLAEKDLTRIIAVSEFTSFGADVYLAQRGEELARIYFPVSGYASLVVSDGNKAKIQIALAGAEGVFGWESLPGRDEFLFDIYVPETLRAISIEAEAFRTLVAEDKRWMVIHLEYLARLFGVTARGVLCARFHALEARLARFLLEVDDRHRKTPILLTQSTLAHLLGVRRSGVTNAATHLQLLGLISYRRGEIVLLDRHGLEAAACDCYRFHVEQSSR